jgi:hypothetical protein
LTLYKNIFYYAAMDEEHIVSASYEEPKHDSSNKGLLIIIFILLLILVGGGAFVFGTKQSNKQVEVTPTPAEVTAIPTEVLGTGTETSPTPTTTQKVTAVSLAVAPQNATTCPTTFEFSGSIKVDAPGTVKYRWVKSDGSTPVEEQSDFIIAGTKTVATSWKLFGSYAGWVKLEVLSPNLITSNSAQFKLTCATTTKLQL